jgi:hypothetical protein
MTISTQTFRFPYVSTGGTTYPYTNKILSQNDLKVYVADVLKTLTTDYTVSGVGTAAGGNVVFLVAPAVGVSVLITKDGVEFTQETDYVENDSFPAADHENALDKLTNIAQKIWDYTRRSVKVAITSALTDLEFPTPVANTYVGWNGTATGLENKTLIALGSISDTAYNSTAWDGVTTITPSQNALRDQIEAMISDVTYNSTTWDNDITASPSKNATRDKFESLVVDIAAKISDTAYNSTAWDNVTTIAPSKNAMRDILETKKISGDTVQVVNTQTGEVATGTTALVFDDSKPLITEGDEYMDLVITPQGATNILKIDVVAHISNSNAAQNIGVTLCQDAIATALAAGFATIATAAYMAEIKITHYMVAGTVASTTFSVRGGGSMGATTTFNGVSGSRVLGGALASSITITEICV